jgi:hypothetical protein
MRFHSSEGDERWISVDDAPGAVGERHTRGHRVGEVGQALSPLEECVRGVDPSPERREEHSGERHTARTKASTRWPIVMKVEIDDALG